MKKRPVGTLDSLLPRRQVLSFMGGTAVVWLVGCLRGRSASITPTRLSAQTVAVPGCVVKPQQTEGPYFIDEKINRSDIRLDPADNSVKQGIPLRLIFQISQIYNNACTPLPNAIVDVWHCDAEGLYSDVSDRDFSTVGKKFLRGYQITNANGIAEFMTIYPGWYPGRTVHIHFKIRTNSTAQRGYEFTSQLYFDDTITDQVHTQPPYAAKGQRTQKNTHDGIFQNGGDQLLLQLTKTSAGYQGRFSIGLESA